MSNLLEVDIKPDTRKRVCIPKNLLEHLDELCGEAEMTAFAGGKIKGDIMLPSNPDLAKFSSEVYKIVHWYLSPDCRVNHKSWKPNVEIIEDE